MSDLEISAMRERIAKLEAEVGEHGLRAEVRGLRSDIGTLFERLAASERRFAMMVGGGVVVLWIVERFLK
ncbi:hypothetical protein [Geminisphaera colitermitum]|uniref:hypothetical protein n=1 Tax=Geminisphaera colitermitum TaxID=1148786 RepID=UPI0012FEF4BD|nr:hypothetical protein [Geminisphaera colitermitum]